MQLERILLPIDVNRCSLEVLGVANAFARRPEAVLVLLHVVNLNIEAPENRIYQELADEARSYLQRLAREYLNLGAAVLVRVRAGQPAEEILAEAKAQHSGLILLPVTSGSWRERLRARRCPALTPRLSPLAQRIVRETECGVCLIGTKTRTRFSRAWGTARSSSPVPSAGDLEPALPAAAAQLLSSNSRYVSPSAPNRASFPARHGLECLPY